MIKLSRMADYGVLVLSIMARKKHALYTAGELATASGLNLPTVTKVLKQLSSAGILSSSRGVGGGYALSRSATCISVADIVEAIDGPVALTHCSRPDQACKTCGLEATCGLQDSWQRLNNNVRQALTSVSLVELAHQHPLVSDKPSADEAAK